ncbi:MAG TPA: twin-arginine translocation signal domain-containing protein [Actinomycetota bacterium]|nr:twin-arginine translocation signal domain-containing protein [Actinomycetota bacterium]
MSTAASGGEFDRRQFLKFAALGAGALAMAPILEACSKARVQIPATLKSVADGLRAEKADLQLFPGGQEFLSSRPQRFSFGATDANGAQILGPPARVWIAPQIGPASSAQGPFGASLARYRMLDQPGDPPGFYVVTLPMPASGLAWVLVESRGIYGISPIAVIDSPTTTGIGQRAVSVATPTPGHLGGVANLCTRKPVCPMHSVSLDKALRAHKPIVFTIASPLLCTSRTCGPVVDEVLDVRARHLNDAIFIHAEPYKGNQATILSPVATAWKIPSEPWVWVIDKTAVVRARFEGPVVAAEIEPELTKVL